MLQVIRDQEQTVPGRVQEMLSKWLARDLDS